MMGKIKRENPVRLVGNLPAFNNEFAAWLFDVPQIDLEAEIALQEAAPKGQDVLPEAWVQQAQAKRLRLKAMGLEDMGDVVQFFMDGGDA